MSDRATLVVHRALTALHRDDTAELARQLHPDVSYDSGGELISGRDAVVCAISAPRFAHLEAEIVPGRIEEEGDRFVAQTLTVLRWRASSEPADISAQTFAIQVRDGLIARLELLAPPASPPASGHPDEAAP